MVQLLGGFITFSSVPMQPFSHWSMDLIWPLPKSRSGNDLIVTWVDRTSKLIVARALRQGNSSAKVLADLTFEAACCRFGLPARLTHDNDVRFRSLWKELWRLMNTKITCT
jgi:IS30 family transposase